MIFVLQDAKLSNNIMTFSRRLSDLKKLKSISEYKIKQIHQRGETIENFDHYKGIKDIH